MSFTAKDVQNLREITGAGMMDCKKALTESNGDIDKAMEFLREKGLAAAAKKASRIAAEGMAYAFVDDNKTGVVLEINSETDFAAKSDNFQAFVCDVAKIIASNKPSDVEALLALNYTGSNMTVSDMLKEKVLTIGENIQIRRFEVISGGVNATYIHAGGKIGVLVNLEVSDNIKDDARVLAAGKDVCMQIAAMNPKWLDRTEVPADVMEKEKQFLLNQTMSEGKPQAVAEKIVAGRINKFYEENCLVDQTFVKENKLSISKFIAEVTKECGGEIKIAKFVRFEKGEGLQKREDNFAEEVAKMQGN